MTLDGAPYAPRARGRRRRWHRLHSPGAQPVRQSLDRREHLHRSLPSRGFGPLRLSTGARCAHARSLPEQVDLELAPDTLVEGLSPGERQLVEVAKALQLDASIIIFDEPTTSLTARETDRLFALIEQLRESGKSMIYISHILADVLRLADDVAVLRDGGWSHPVHGPSSTSAG